MYRHLSVPIPEGSEPTTTSVERCLEQFFQPVPVEVNCMDKNCVGKTATQTIEVISWYVLGLLFMPSI